MELLFASPSPGSLSIRPVKPLSHGIKSDEDNRLYDVLFQVFHLLVASG
jgi:hypothetical protein